MADANLLSALAKEGKRGFLENMVIFGRVRCAIKYPKSLMGNLATEDVGAFAILDAYALKCKGRDYFAEDGISPSSVYFTKGSMIIYINDPKWIGKDVKVGGTSLSKGVKIRQQFGHVSEYDGISALAFAREGSSYVVVANAITELCGRDEDIRTTPLEDFMVKLNGSDVIEYPVTLDSIVAYSGVNEYEVLDSMTSVDDSFKSSDERLDVTKIDLNLTYHLKGKEVSDFLEPFQDEIKGMSFRKSEYKKDLSYKLSKAYRDGKNNSTATDIRRAFVKNIANNFTQNVGNSKIKGRKYVDDVISKVASNPFDAEDDSKIPNDVLMKAKDMLTSMFQADPSILMERSLPDIQDIPNLSVDSRFALCVVSATTGIGIDSLRSNYLSCCRNISLDFHGWFFALLNMPYSLGIVGSGLNLVDLDIIYLSYTRNFTANNYKAENKDYRDDLVFLQSLDNASDKDTCIDEYTLSKTPMHYPKIGKDNLYKYYFPAKIDTIEVLRVMCGEIKLTGKARDSLVNDGWYSSTKRDELIDKGLVNLLEDDNKNFILLERDLEKSVLIYSTLINMGETETGISVSNVEKTIDEFEKEKGFKLEALQRDGIKLSMYHAGVLSGCAGSGKTTTSDCLSKCLEDNLEGYKIIYSTPTGKACRRLAEVVGGTVKTIHSQFGVGLSGDSYLTDIKKKYQSSDATKKIYILDEMAMADTNLLYEVVRSLKDSDIIYFLGDIKQLPPIGKGNPFYLLMQILPCVELGVSKRAAEGSSINYNTTLVNNVSDGVMYELSYNDSDFLCRECRDSEIADVILKLWKDFMNGITGTKFAEDDIQVITGYATPNCLFSTSRLNEPLQRYLRREDKLLFRHGERDFFNNERVIHVNANTYSMQRYVEVSPNEFKAVVTFGMMNGEMGKMVGVVRSDMVSIIPFSESDLKEEPLYKHIDKESLDNLLLAREEKEDDLRDDGSIKDSGTYFVKVKVYDVDMGRDIYVLYRANAFFQDNILTLSGKDLSFIDLAYALTTHKMQGSQSPVVIVPFGSTCNPSFINRNMINTMFTRAQKVVGVVGTVLGAESPISKGRKKVSPVLTKDIFTILSRDNE